MYDDYAPASNEPDGWIVEGGTSESSPFIAGVYARGGHLTGVERPSSLYADPASDFNDVAVGQNAEPSSGCPTALCVSGPGWDGPTARHPERPRRVLIPRPEALRRADRRPARRRARQSRAERPAAQPVEATVLKPAGASGTASSPAMRLVQISLPAAEYSATTADPVTPLSVAVWC